ncbi:hypothetical protein NP493_403g02042 [Ridgeia piscesae]|uniref:Small integral membrane protein 13 n=1 Tax=Ridgeia piscesae TaxID=27915 RepID=A0AAD9L0Y1_RIDPI|nr:hypothetical protein NP493_403g02042 [Ridgeia piscesae]
MKELVLSVFSVIASLLFVIIFILIGWYIVWKVFISRFKFVQELIGMTTEQTSTEEMPKVRSKKARFD